MPLSALERDRTAMATQHATAGLSFGEQRCFVRAGFEAALTAAGVPLPETLRRQTLSESVWRRRRELDSEQARRG